MAFRYSDADHLYTLDEVPIPSLTQMLDADGCNEHLDRVPAATLEAKRQWGIDLHLALAKAEYGYGIDEAFKTHCVNWLDACRRMKWGDPSKGILPIWKVCELPRLAQIQGFVFGFTPDRAAPEAVVEIKGTYDPHYSHGIQTALQVLGMGYSKETPRWVAYFSRDGLRRLHQCGETVTRGDQKINVWDECDRILFERALHWENREAEPYTPKAPAIKTPYPLTPEQIERINVLWTEVESSQISEVGYDAATSTLGIRFKPGKKSPASEYHYANVPVSMYEDLVTADSVGSYFGANIKNDPTTYPYTKVA